MKNGKKGPINASFWAINSKPHPPQTCSSGEKNDLKKGGGGMIELDNIYPCNIVNIVSILDHYVKNFKMHFYVIFYHFLHLTLSQVPVESCNKKSIVGGGGFVGILK